jgi:hypothetical protein
MKRLIFLLLVSSVFIGVGLGLFSAEKKMLQANDSLEQAQNISDLSQQTYDDMMPDDRSLDGLPAYPEAAPRKMFREAAVMGIPMSVSWFETTDSIVQIVNFYQNTFADAGISATSHMYSETKGYVAWKERPASFADAGPGAGLLHMISMTTEHGRTIVFLSASRPELRTQEAAILPFGLRMPAGSSAPQFVNVSAGEVDNAFFTSTNAVLKAQEIFSDLEGQFQTKGFIVRTGSEKMLAVNKEKNQRVTIWVQKESESTKIFLRAEEEKN